jgi:cytochrome c oxidase subunit 1
VSLPRIRSESPAFDLHHPEVALLELEENEPVNQDGEFADTPEVQGRAAHLREQAEGAPPQGRDRGEGDEK